MEYYLSVDGGGTKLISNLFDGNFRLIGSGRGEGVNPNFESHGNIEKNMSRSMNESLMDSGVSQISDVWIGMPGPADLYMELLKSKVIVRHHHVCSEGHMCLYAGIAKERGIIALAGTGSGVFNIEGEVTTHMGGWGSLVGDEGSGYYVGREAIASAIRNHEHTGEKTVINEMLIKEYQADSLGDFVTKLYRCNNQRRFISGLSELASRAARKGDEAAIGIFEEAGRQLALQTIALMKRDSVAESVDVVTAGSVWKGHEAMFACFKRIVNDSFPKTAVMEPLFDPVMGGVIKRAIDAYGRVNDDLMRHFKSEFKVFLHKSQENGEKI